MTKSLRILVLLVIAAGMAFWIINRQPWSTLKSARKDFSIKDTNSITKIFLADKKGQKILLVKSDGKWSLNNQFAADPTKVNMMLATIHDMEVRNPITEAENNTVIADLAAFAVKAEFYSGEDIVKTLFVGNSTPDLKGTYMLIDGSSAPFVIHIPGFEGYLTPRFNTEEKKWRIREIFNVPPDQISKVELQYPDQPTESFSIDNSNSPLLFSSYKQMACDTKYLQYYLSSFNKLYFETYSEVSQHQMDSIHQTTPWCIITLTKKNGIKTRVQLHRKPVDRRTREQFDQEGVPIAFDKEKYFGFMNDGTDMVVIQDYVFGKILKTLDEIITISMQASEQPHS